MAEKGRKGAKSEFFDTIAPKSAEQAMLLKLDEIIDVLKAFTAKLDDDFKAQNLAVSDSTLSEDYAEKLTDALAKIKLK